MNSKKLKRVILGLFSLVIAACIVIAAAFVFSSFVYNADTVAVACLESNDRVTVRAGTNYIAFEPKQEHGVLVIFYPSSFVDYQAYAPLMQELAGRGIVSVVCKMPASLASLGKNAADGLEGAYPDITCRIMAGHGYGAYYASSYATGHEDSFDGVILLAGPPAKTLKQTSLTSLYIRGDNDGIVSRRDLERHTKGLPEGFMSVQINGGNHAQFGNYGTQWGDRDSSLYPEEQLEMTADAIVRFVDGISGFSQNAADEIPAEETTAE